MQKKTLSKKLLLIATLSAGIPALANADDNSLTVNGTVYTTACTITATFLNPTWAIGNITLTSQPAAGDVLAGPTGFSSLNLTTCPVLTNVSFNFAGEPDSDMPELFKVADGVGQASGVAFKLEVGNATNGYEQLLPQTNSNNYQTTSGGLLSGKTVRGSLIATGGKTNFTGTTGTLNTTMTYSIEYN